MRQLKQQIVPRRVTLGKVFTAIAVATVARDAGAQIDTNPPLQNVMLLVDSSGSMEYANDGSVVTCDETDASLPASIAPKGTSQKTRWMQLIEVLTGDVKDPECYSQDRGSTSFKNEFSLGGALPYDFNYHVPYHRFLSGSGAAACTIGAGVPDANPFAWGSTPFKYHIFNSPGTACTNFEQSETGLLDSYRDRMRFGLMTFDTSIDAGTGLAGGTADYLNGNTGTWSYFLNWRLNPDCNANASCAKGRPAGCATIPDPAMEVGARNAAAPPWEGRMVPFGSPAATITDVRNTNEHIQQVLTALRPFGATPINGLLNDARDFFKNDGDKDYVTGAASCDNQTGVGCFGPKDDGLIKNGCRTNNIILLTDGEPNLDLRPYCEGSSGGYDGHCPYADTTDKIVQDLATNTDPRKAIKTFVIGFAVSTVTTGQPQPLDCSKISSFNQDQGTGQFDPGDVCSAKIDPVTMQPIPLDPKLSACCTLAKIAFYGGTGNAYFATNATELREAISDIFDRIGGAISTRTAPVFATNANANQGGAFSFYSSFHSGRDMEGGVTLKASVWSGILERQRTECEAKTQNGITTITPERRDIDSDKGDRFSDNVNAADTSHPRTFYTVVANDDGSGNRNSLGTIRPSIPSTNPDGLGIASGVAQHGGTSDFPTVVPPAAMTITSLSCAGDGPPYDSDDNACAAKYLKWEVGVDPMPGSDPPAKFQRPNVFGAIYHSTPTLVGAPNEFLRDESYTQFTVEQALRPPMLYTSTTDGQLHAFKVDKAPGDTSDTAVDKKVNNEIWSFLPPAVLPKLPAQFPRTQQMILDGAPMVKDVVFVRSDADAKNGGSGVHWHTVLVSSFGSGGTGYFALDITNPIPKSTDPTTTGPQLLWQLTTDDTPAHNRLFGKNGGTPAIATLFFSQTGTDPKEYAVAILPGGRSGGPTEMCAKPSSTLVDTAAAPRDQVRCLSAPGDPARSVTIVRLDTGEVIRSFRREIDGPASILPRSHNDMNAYAELVGDVSGQPVVFPADTGAVSDRAFVGDSEGLLWRLDLSSTNPEKWTMDLFFDAYTGQAWDAGQPIATPPILSVDAVGNLTVAFSTGDQEVFSEKPGVTNYLWSINEQAAPDPPFVKSRSNWDLTFPRADVTNERAGARVSGPMQLFNSNLYFTTYNPPPLAPTASDLCSDGNAGLCAMNYLRAAAAAHKGGAVASPALDTTQPDQPCLPEGNSVIFGPGITQEPTCFATDTYNDPYLGTSKHTSLTNVNAGKFNLVVQTGMHGTNETKGQINTTTMALQTPVASTRIDSWAAVVE
jgi:type IV pilus assembly protein PilY1